MPILEIVKIITPILIIALVGFIFGRLRKIDLKTIADLIIYVTAPALALTQLSMQRMDIQEIMSISGAAIFVILGCGLIAYLIFKLTKASVPIGLYLPIMFMNTGFIGYPLALFAFGGIGLNKAIIYDITNAVLIFTLGIYIASHGKDRWQALKIPFIYAAAAGLILSFTGIRLPHYLYSPLYIIGGTTIPLALLMLGCRLANMKITSWKLPAIASIIRIGAGLGLGFLAVFIFRLSGVTAKVVILISSLSSAITCIALSEEYDTDKELIASTIALSTIISFVAIIIILNWLAKLTI
ncbi:MAG: AEC family transporter [Candidatus Margulisiibacteriota bacterium]